jgi:hypothetical protein
MRVHYSFRFDDGAEIQVPLSLDDKLHLQLPEERNWPEWTFLEYHQCETCPYQGERCPAAQGILHLDVLRGRSSFEEVLCEVKTPNRTFKARVPLDVAMGSALGLILATAGCPVLDHFRPMAALHLPFASASETFLRNAAIALYAQWQRSQEGLPAALDFEHLHQVYAQVGKVNQQLCARLTEAQKSGNAADAVFLLDLFTRTGGAGKSTRIEAELKPLFTAWMQTEF